MKPGQAVTVVTAGGGLEDGTVQGVSLDPMTGRADSYRVGFEDGTNTHIGAAHVRPRLTAADVERALEDERHCGFGFAVRRQLPKRRAAQMTAAVVARANDLGLDYEALFHWTNHKNARWACDAATFERPAADIVRELMPPPCDKCGGHGCGWCD